MEKEKGYLSEVSAITLKYKFHRPPETPLVFYGSSNFKKWTSLESDFSEYNALNHGFGGSNDRDLLTYAEKLVLSLSPKTLVLNTSSNDVGTRPISEESVTTRIRLRNSSAVIDLLAATATNSSKESMTKRYTLRFSRYNAVSP